MLKKERNSFIKLLKFIFSVLAGRKRMRNKNSSLYEIGCHLFAANQLKINIRGIDIDCDFKVQFEL